MPAHAGAGCADAGAGDAGLVIKDWVSMPAKQCFAHRLPASAACPTSYRSQAIAQSECLASAACSGVYRPLGGGVFFLCDAQHPVQQSVEGGVVLRKTHAAAQAAKARLSSAVGKRKPGQAQAGKWCSNWCCCAHGYHGEVCGDVDECLSAPCSNGGTCGESSSTYLVNDYWRKYTCDCAAGFRGHSCEKTAAAPAKGNYTACALRLGAKSASGSTTTLYAYTQFQMALRFTGVTLRSDDANFEGFCAKVRTRPAPRHSGSALWTYQ